MVWFVLAILVTVFFHMLVNEKDAPVALFAGFLIAFLVNVFLTGTNGERDTVNATVTGQVELKEVNDEASYVFTAGGKDYVIPADDAEVELTTGPEKYVVVSNVEHPFWISVFDYDYVESQTIYVNNK